LAFSHGVSHNFIVHSGVLKAARRVELTALEVLDQSETEDAEPSIEVGQLLRSLPQPGEEAGDASKGAAGAVMLAVRAGDGDRGLAGVLSAGQSPGAAAAGW
jgi:hypothetical protein